MTRHIQGAEGNCVQVCLACIFDVPVHEAPHVFAKRGGWTKGKWKTIVRWARQRGYEAIWLNAVSVIALAASGAYYIGIWPTTEGEDTHAVVMQWQEVVHDPAAPSGICGAPVAYIGFRKQEWNGGRAFAWLVLLASIWWLLFGG
jgi:hypothetical protein